MAAGGSLGTQLGARRHTTFLVAIVAAIAVRPVIGDVRFGPIVFSLIMAALLLVALSTIEVDELVGDRSVLLAQRRRNRIVGCTLAALAMGDRFLVLVSSNPRLRTAGVVCWFLFFAFATWIELRTMLRQRQVTNETISMAISAYLLLGLTWALLYIMLFQLDATAFSFESFAGTKPMVHDDLPVSFPIFTSFSLATICTLGFGDVTPVALSARYAAVAEGITGQFYLAILVARLVAMQMSGPQRDRP
jgi:voltage-gated potassium channel